jgi:trigger factor
MNLEILDSIKRKVTFTIKKEDVNKSSQEELKKYIKNVKIDGFRKGKAPINIVEQMYGGKAFEDSLNNHINKVFSDVISNNKLNIVNTPEFDLINKDDKEAEEFIFSAQFEVIPEIIIGDLSKQEVTKFECIIDEDQVNKTITSLRKQKTQYIKCDKAAQNDDQVKISFVGSIDGVEFEGGKSDDYQFILGQGKMLPDFENGIKDMLPNEIKNITVNFPENYHSTNLKGKTAIFTITLKEVNEPILPELNSEFIQNLGVNSGNIDDLKKEINNNLNLEIKRRIKIKLRDSSFEALNKSTPIDVPYTLVHNEIHHMMDNAQKNLKQSQYSNSDIKLTHDMFAQDAKRTVTYRLLIQQFIEDNAIIVNDDEIRAIIEEQSQMYDDKDEYIKWFNQDKNRIKQAKFIALENKVVDIILSKVKLNITNISCDDLMQLDI